MQFSPHFYNLMLPRTSLVLVNMGRSSWLLNSALWIASTSGWNPRRTSCASLSLRLEPLYSEPLYSDSNLGAFGIADGRESRDEGMGTLEEKARPLIQYRKLMSLKIIVSPQKKFSSSSIFWSLYSWFSDRPGMKWAEQQSDNRQTWDFCQWLIIMNNISPIIIVTPWEINVTGFKTNLCMLTLYMSLGSLSIFRTWVQPRPRRRPCTSWASRRAACCDRSRPPSPRQTSWQRPPQPLRAPRGGPLKKKDFVFIFNQMCSLSPNLNRFKLEHAL